MNSTKHTLFLLNGAMYFKKRKESSIECFYFREQRKATVSLKKPHGYAFASKKSMKLIPLFASFKI